MWELKAGVEAIPKDVKPAPLDHPLAAFSGDLAKCVLGTVEDDLEDISNPRMKWVFGWGESRVECDFVQREEAGDEITLSLALEIAIPVNLEAIWTTMITSKIFWPLYLGYNQVLHYGLQLNNFDISLAFTYNWHPWTYLLSSNMSSKS